MCKHGLELLEMTAVGLPRLQISDYVCTLMKEGGKTAQFMQAIRFNLAYLYFVMAIIYKENSFQGIFEETLQRHRKVRYSTYSPRIFSKMLKTRIYPSN